MRNASLSVGMLRIPCDSWTRPYQREIDRATQLKSPMLVTAHGEARRGIALGNSGSNQPTIALSTTTHRRHHTDNETDTH